MPQKLISPGAKCIEGNPTTPPNKETERLYRESLKLMSSEHEKSDRETRMRGLAPEDTVGAAVWKNSSDSSSEHQTRKNS